MMKKVQKGILILLASFVLSSSVPASVLPCSSAITAEAHSGRTDSRGGHRDNKNKSGLGSYHYHCGGHPAHLHPNGVCPYSGQSSSSGSAAQSSASLPSASAPAQTPASGSNASADQLPQQAQPAESTDQALLEKYADVLSDYASKQNGYFTPEISQLVSDFLAALGQTDSASLSGFLTPEEAADLSPALTSTQADISSKIIYMRLYEVFAAQYQEQQTASGTAQAAAEQPVAGQEDFQYQLVLQTQTALAVLGFYTGETDGIFDEETRQALIQFQTAYGLTADGTINQQVVTVLGIGV